MDNRTAKDICEAFSIFADYDPQDVLFVGYGGEWQICATPPQDMDSIDEDRLKKLGWHWKEDEKTWEIF